MTSPSHQVVLQPSGRLFAVDADEAVLTAAARQGIGLPYGCRNGACGSCKCRLVEGQVVHRPHQASALTADEEAAGWMLSCCAIPQTDLLVEARNVGNAGDLPVRKLPARVMSIERAAPDVAVLRLQLPAHDPLRWRAGQYVDVLLGDNVRRSYSIAQAPGAKGAEGEPPSIELHIRHLPGGLFSDRVFSTLKPRDLLRIEGPLGSFYLNEDATKPLVLLAAGTGLAPIKALIEHLRDRPLPRPAVLYWGCRSRVDLYLHDWALAAAAELPWLRYVPVLSQPLEGDDWQGRTGFVHHALMADMADLSGHEVYACGSPAMVEAAQRDLCARAGLPAEAFFADAFTLAAA